MVYVVVVIHLLVAVALVISVLLQSGRGGGIAGALGGTTGASSVFGGRGAGDILMKVTAILAIVFVVLTVAINLVTTKPSATRPESVIATEAKKSGLPQTGAPDEGEMPQEVPFGE